MSKLLYVTVSPLTGEKSKSMNVGDHFLNDWKANHPNDNVETLDLFKGDIPFLNQDIFDAWSVLKSGESVYTLPKKDREKVRRNDELLNQFMEADKIVFVNPMWNLFFPPVLKAYIDILCVAGKTFAYTAEGPVGLLKDKKVLHIQSSGGVYDRSEGAPIVDFGDAYLKHMMGFFGIFDYEAIHIDGIDAAPDKKDEIMGAAKDKASEIAKKF
ncbi:FMN-dependent NADH-azoreductase [Metaclostridioides mangenotii]|uniref:FMN dependent NADH:quinone oxidoreductase n=1 Tax=Metaclostridioides mangenotii TaxID=1540 RepID=A0ABS4E913_9FIRM|nr:NAD(P)H-dependent oxidoreductase [Clostridioides mangenotii]MBP1854424.1 FMN-dependent NADH-azoreductase [Clostridioides mangenotii]